MTLNEEAEVKFILDNWMLIAVALSCGIMLMMPALKGAGQGALTPEATVQLMNREKAVLVDVCEPAEYAAGHIIGAKNIPLGQLEQKLASSVKNKTQPLVLVCQSGARSMRALGIAKKLGYENAQSMAGGMSAWRNANLPIEKA